MKPKDKDWIFRIKTFIHRFYYPDKQLEFTDITIPRNKLNIITGETGLGKTTLLNIIGLEDDFVVHTNSDILFKPESESEIFRFSKIYKNRKMIQNIRESYFGFMFQHDYLIDRLTCWENVIIPYMLRNKATKINCEKDLVKKLIEEFGFTDLLESKTTNHSKRISPMDRSPSTLSGGQRQRVALLRAMIHSPRILFADEPMASVNLDVAKSIISAFIQKIKSGMTIIMIGHDTHNDIYRNETENFEKYVNEIYLENHVNKN